MKKIFRVIVPILSVLIIAIVVSLLVKINKNDTKINFTDIDDNLIIYEEPIEVKDKFNVEIVERNDYSYIIPEREMSALDDEAIITAEIIGVEHNLENIDYSEEEFEKVSRQGLVDWAYRAYDEGWQYVYGGCEEGRVDCSGFIKAYVGVCARGTEEQLAESKHKGDISTIPEIPGLGVYMEGHVGIYVGNGMVIDARNERDWIRYDTIDYMSWSMWYEIKGVEYEYELD